MALGTLVQHAICRRGEGGGGGAECESNTCLVYYRESLPPGRTAAAAHHKTASAAHTRARTYRIVSDQSLMDILYSVTDHDHDPYDQFPNPAYPHAGTDLLISLALGR